MAIIGYDDIVDFIKSNYPKGSHIVEVGIGRHPEVAQLLKDDFDIVCTDVFEGNIPGITYIRDDIFNPDLRIYEGAVLIYSIRPPIDMQDSIAAIARRVGADLLIRPFSSERTNLEKYFKSFRCINYKSAVFYLYKPVQGT